MKPLLIFVDLDGVLADFERNRYRVWPVPEGAHSLSATCASAAASVLILDITGAEKTGRLPSWDWLRAAP